MILVSSASVVSLAPLVHHSLHVCCMYHLACATLSHVPIFLTILDSHFRASCLPHYYIYHLPLHYEQFADFFPT
jgi:hypothetical protein